MLKHESSGIHRIDRRTLMRHCLWWASDAIDTECQPPLAGSGMADVAIVGGGFVGLWTAIRLKELDPLCDVVVLERDLAGAGASGRNGGFVLSWWAKLPTLVKCFGTADALRLAVTFEGAISDIDSFCVVDLE
jgi:FAD dependent oxidoreductase